jgi:hypothetical protein
LLVRGHARSIAAKRAHGWLHAWFVGLSAQMLDSCGLILRISASASAFSALR